MKIIQAKMGQRIIVNFKVFSPDAREEKRRLYPCTTITILLNKLAKHDNKIQNVKAKL